MRALVTGSTGFIGRHLVRVLAEAGHEVVCLVRATSRRGPLERYATRFAVGDIGDRSTLSVVGEVDVVFHLASLLKMPWKQAFHDVNVGGTENVVVACAEAEHPPVLVVVSSLAAGGPTAGTGGGARNEEDGAAPVSIYGRVKLASEAVTFGYAGTVPTTIVRPPMVFGEGDTSVLKLYRGAAKGWHVVPGPDDHRVSFVHATDLAHALLAVAERGERVPVGGTCGQGVYYVADDARPTYADFGRMVGGAVGREVRVVHLPRAVVWCAAALSEWMGRLRDRPAMLNLDKLREAAAGSWVCDVGKAHRALGWVAEAPEVRLRQTAEWYRAEGWL